MFRKLKLLLALRKFWNWATGQNWKEGLAMPEVVNGVPVKPVRRSKIMWGAGVLLVFGILSYFGINVEPDQQEQIATGLDAIMDWILEVAVPFIVKLIIPFLLMVWRAFSNNTVTPSAVNGVRDPGGN